MHMNKMLLSCHDMPQFNYKSKSKLFLNFAGNVPKDTTELIREMWEEYNFPGFISFNRLRSAYRDLVREKFDLRQQEEVHKNAMSTK